MTEPTIIEDYRSLLTGSDRLAFDLGVLKNTIQWTLRVLKRYDGDVPKVNKEMIIRELEWIEEETL